MNIPTDYIVLSAKEHNNRFPGKWLVFSFTHGLGTMYNDKNFVPVRFIEDTEDFDIHWEYFIDHMLRDEKEKAIEVYDKINDEHPKNLDIILYEYHILQEKERNRRMLL